MKVSLGPVARGVNRDCCRRGIPCGLSRAACDAAVACRFPGLLPGRSPIRRAVRLLSWGPYQNRFVSPPPSEVEACMGSKLRFEGDWEAWVDFFLPLEMGIARELAGQWEIKNDAGVCSAFLQIAFLRESRARRRNFLHPAPQGWSKDSPGSPQAPGRAAVRVVKVVSSWGSFAAEHRDLVPAAGAFRIREHHRRDARASR